MITEAKIRGIKNNFSIQPAQERRVCATLKILSAIWQNPFLEQNSPFSKSSIHDPAYGGAFVNQHRLEAISKIEK
jgi:hypothetical protein